MKPPLQFFFGILQIYFGIWPFFGQALRRTTPWSPWTVDPLHAGITQGVVLALLLLVVFVRRRMRPVVAADTHVEVPDYLDPRRKIKVPRTELCEPLDDQFYALHLGRVTFVVKIYWRHVHF